MADDEILAPGAVALVTGASAGIGAAIAEALAARGCRVICAARRLDRLTAVAETLGDAGHPFELDVDDGDSVAGLVDRLPADWRAIDILVNNAGHAIGGRKPLHQGDADDWARIIQTNVTGYIRVCHAVLPGMVARGRGHIVNLGSISGLAAYPEDAVYTASKFAVHGLTDNLRIDYARHGIRVTEVLPGLVRTEFAGVRYKDAAHGDEYYAERGAALAPEDIARCVVFALEQPRNMSISQILVEPSG